MRTRLTPATLMLLHYGETCPKGDPRCRKVVEGDGDNSNSCRSCMHVVGRAFVQLREQGMTPAQVRKIVADTRNAVFAWVRQHKMCDDIIEAWYDNSFVSKALRRRLTLGKVTLGAGPNKKKFIHHETMQVRVWDIVRTAPGKGYLELARFVQGLTGMKFRVSRSYIDHMRATGRFRVDRSKRKHGYYCVQGMEPTPELFTPVRSHIRVGDCAFVQEFDEVNGERVSRWVRLPRDPNGRVVTWYMTRAQQEAYKLLMYYKAADAAQRAGNPPWGADSNAECRAFMGESVETQRLAEENRRAVMRVWRYTVRARKRLGVERAVRRHYPLDSSGRVILPNREDSEIFSLAS